MLVVVHGLMLLLLELELLLVLLLLELLHALVLVVHLRVLLHRRGHATQANCRVQAGRLSGLQHHRVRRGH